jgi:hypothetical protein
MFARQMFEVSCTKVFKLKQSFRRAKCLRAESNISRTKLCKLKMFRDMSLFVHENWQTQQTRKQKVVRRAGMFEVSCMNTFANF